MSGWLSAMLRSPFTVFEFAITSSRFTLLTSAALATVGVSSISCNEAKTAAIVGSEIPNQNIELIAQTKFDDIPHSSIFSATPAFYCRSTRASLQALMSMRRSIWWFRSSSRPAPMLQCELNSTYFCVRKVNARLDNFVNNTSNTESETIPRDLHNFVIRFRFKTNLFDST